MRLLHLLLLLILAGQTLAQQPPPLPQRQVSGVVRDSSGAVDIPQASVLLITPADTLSAVTNGDGIFVFEAVKSAEFTIVVRHMGYQPFLQRYLMNDTKPRLTLAPVLLHTAMQALSGVTIKGKTGPQMLGDTVQFWADDYIVRDYARLEELVKKLEGVSVDKDGNVLFMGQLVKKAMFNGIRYFGGDVKQLLKELPANIVERIQIIDDYGDQANAAGIKTGASTKSINIVSKKDKSVANLYDVTAEANLDARYNGHGYIKHIDGVHQLEVQGGAEKMPAGIIAGPPVGTISKTNAMQFTAGPAAGISGGRRQNAYGIFTYKNQFRQFLTYELYYNLQHKDNLELKDVVQQEYFPAGTLTTTTHQSATQRQTQHDGKGIFNAKLSANAQLNTTIGFKYSSDEQERNSNAVQAGLLHQGSLQHGTQSASRPALDLDLLYIQRFNHSKTTLTAGLCLLNAKDCREKNDEGAITSPDSSYHVLSEVNSRPRGYLAALTFTHPFNDRTTLQLKGDWQFRQVDYQQQFYNKLSAPQRVDSLSAGFTYTTIDNPIVAALKQRIGGKSILTAGLRLQQTWMKNLQARHRAKLFPELLYEYSNGMRTQFSFRYNGNAILPGMEEVLPMPDVSNPLNTVKGNPDLNPAAVHQFQARLARFLLRADLFFSVTAMYALTAGKVTPDITFHQNGSVMSRTTGFTNVNGDTKMQLYYNLTKSFTYRSLSLKLDGQLSRNRMMYLSQQVVNSTTSLMNNNALTAALTPWRWLDLQAAAGVDWSHGSDFAALNSTRSRFNLCGTIYLTPEWLIGFDVSKKLERSSDAALNRSPLIVGLNMEKRLFPRKNGVISFLVMDLLRQDRAVSRQLLFNGYRDIPTAQNSRYFLLQFSWSPQRWTGGRNAGKARRNDGSFVD